MRKTRKLTDPRDLTFDDAFNAAISLVKKEHSPKKPCVKCRKTLGLLKTLKKQLNHQAIGNNLVWAAYKGKRILGII